MSTLILTIRAIINEQQRIPRQRNNQEFQRRGNIPSFNGCFYYEDLYFMFTEHCASSKDNVTNQYIYIDNNLVFFKPRVLNT